MLTNEWTLEIRSRSDSAPAVGTDGTIYLRHVDRQALGGQPGRVAQVDLPGAGTRSSLRPPLARMARSISAAATGDSTPWGPTARSAGSSRPGAGWTRRPRWRAMAPSISVRGTRTSTRSNADGTKRWQFTTPGEIVSSPAIGADGTIYFGSHDKKFYALAADGRKKWEFATGGPILSSPALNKDQCLYFTSVDGCLYALNLDGSLRWRLRTGGITESSPVIGAGRHDLRGGASAPLGDQRRRQEEVGASWWRGLPV